MAPKRQMPYSLRTTPMAARGSVALVVNKGKGKDQHWREFLNSAGLQESDDGIVATNEDDGGTISDHDEIGLAAAWEAYKHDIWMSGHVF